jgi:hypothetical protein
MIEIPLATVPVGKIFAVEDGGESFGGLVIVGSG